MCDDSVPIKHKEVSESYTCTLNFFRNDLTKRSQFLLTLNSSTLSHFIKNVYFESWHCLFRIELKKPCEIQHLVEGLLSLRGRSTMPLQCRVDPLLIPDLGGMTQNYCPVIYLPTWSRAGSGSLKLCQASLAFRYLAWRWLVIEHAIHIYLIWRRVGIHQAMHSFIWVIFLQVVDRLCYYGNS